MLIVIHFFFLLWLSISTFLFLLWLFTISCQSIRFLLYYFIASQLIRFSFFAQSQSIKIELELNISIPLKTFFFNYFNISKMRFFFVVVYLIRNKQMPISSRIILNNFINFILYAWTNNKYIHHHRMCGLETDELMWNWLVESLWMNLMNFVSTPDQQ